jgi:hypothetical protein
MQSTAKYSAVYLTEGPLNLPNGAWPIYTEGYKLVEYVNTQH